MRIVITTGGTGGHIFPALALAEEIRKQQPDAYILFVGAQYGMEKELCKKANIPFIALNVQGFIGRGLKMFKAAYLLIKEYFKAVKILKEEKIDMVIGFGGYASAPCVIAGKNLRKKVYIHEQNAFFGSFNRHLAKYVTKIMLSMPIENSPHPQEVQEKYLLTGNPVRTEIAELANYPLKSTDTKKLLVLGGSLGAHSINVLMVSLLKNLAKENIKIVHQCGKRDYELVKEAYANSTYSSSCVHAFIDNMQEAYQNADFIIARAGASTLAELACLAKPSILIPFPYAAHNHQFYNAKTLESRKACILLEEKELFANDKILNKEKLLEKILLLANNLEERNTLARNIRTLAKADAVEKMYKVINEKN